MIAAELTVVGGKHAGQVIALNRRKFLIGREQDCQLRPNSEMVSRHHCVFSLDDYSVRLRDLGSTNGTLVNGVRIQKETVLAPNDHIVIGNLEFRLSVRAGQASESISNPAIDLRAQSEDTQVTSHTVMDMPTSQPVAAPATAPAAATPEPVAAAAAPIPSPETTILPAGGMMPQQAYGYPPQMVPQMGYPGGMYGGYPYQPMMPGYGQMYPPMMAPGMGYPMAPQMPGMPQQMAPQMPAPAQPAAPPSANVALPDPSETGAKDSGAAKGSTGSNKSDTAKPTGAADAILKQMMNRRPNS